MIVNKIKRILERKIIVKQGGEQVSVLARHISETRNNVKIGMYSYGSCFESGFNIGGRVLIGRYCSLGPGVKYFGTDHPMHYASMSPYFYRKEWGFDVKDVERKCLKIGNDCWLGNNVTIVSSCEEIGDGAVIGAGAVVTHNVPMYAIAAGVPAKIIGYRFDKETIKALQNSGWWNLSPEQLMEFYDLIENPKKWSTAISNYRK